MERVPNEQDLMRAGEELVKEKESALGRPTTPEEREDIFQKLKTILGNLRGK